MAFNEWSADNVPTKVRVCVFFCTPFVACVILICKLCRVDVQVAYALPEDEE